MAFNINLITGGMDEVGVHRIVKNRAPTSADYRYPLGTEWADNLNDDIWFLAGKTASAGSWEKIIGGSTGLTQLDSDSGSATPTGGAIDIEGGTNINTSASGSKVTVNVDVSPSVEDITVTKTLKTAQGVDVASANDMTLGDGNFFDITGTTTINTIVTKGVGTAVTLQFDGILQLTHSADLFLPTAANITTAAGDIAIFYEYASGDWRCMSYERVDGTALVGGGLTTNTEILAAGKTLTGGTDAPIQLLDTDGVTRIITLATTAVSAGAEFYIMNTSTFTTNKYLTIQVEGGTDLDSISSGTTRHFIYDGTDWVEIMCGTTIADTFRNNTAIGYSSRTYNDGTAIGASSFAEDRSVAVGNGATSTDDSVCVGDLSSADDFGVAVGANTNATHDYGVAIGYYSKTSRYGEMWRSSDASFANDYGCGTYGYINVTTDGIVSEMFVRDASSRRFYVSADSAVTFKILVTAYDNTNDDGHVWEVFGGIKRDGSSNTSFIGSVQVTNELYDTSASPWLFSITADDANESLTLKVTGEVGKTIRWHAKLSTSEVKF